VSGDFVSAGLVVELLSPVRLLEFDSPLEPQPINKSAKHNEEQNKNLPIIFAPKEMYDSLPARRRVSCVSGREQPGRLFYD
jgi:hypothetical protein